MEAGPAGDLARALSGAEGVILAVSGGPDSTALMILAARWTGRPPVLVVSVDHGLRPQAAAEAEQVAANAALLRLPSRIMRCEALQPGGNMQARAREARYACLAAAAREAGFDTIVTAHHQDDQAETFLLRLARGSGVYGLGSIRAETGLGGLKLVRPLLGRTRAELAAIVADAGLSVASDPSNMDERYDRARLRTIMPVLAGQGLNAVRLAGTAARLARAADALDVVAGDLIARHFTVDAFGVVRGEARCLTEAHEEIGLRALSRLLAAAAGAAYGPDIAGVEALLNAVSATEYGAHWRRTLHGAVVTCSGRDITFSREWGRGGLGEIVAEAGESVVWDRRFEVAVPALGTGLSVRALGHADARLRHSRAADAPLRTLPGLYADERLVAAPSGVVSVDREETSPAVLDFVCLVPERLGLRTASVEVRACR